MFSWPGDTTSSSSQFLKDASGKKWVLNENEEAIKDKPLQGNLL